MRAGGKLIVVLGLLVAASATAQPTTAVITSIDPTSIVVASPQFTLQVTGANFVSGAQVRVNSAARTTQFVSSTRLNATIPASDLTTVRTLQISAANPGSSASAAVTFRVVSNTPAITSISPSTVAVGSPITTITVNGSGFASTAIVRAGSTNLTTTFVSETQLTGRVPASELTTARTLNITVMNPSPINRTSNSVPLTVSNNVAPTITSLNPNSVAANSPGFTLTITGTNFVGTSFVRVNANPVATTFIDSTRLTVPISASQIMTAGTISITVTNPNNVGSAPATLTVTSGNIPVIQSITPQSVQAGSSTFSLAVTGMNFVSGSIVRLNGQNRTTTVVDPSHLTATIPSADVTAPGSRSISVFNPSPNGGTSSAVTLTIFSQTAPIITRLTPSSFATGTPSPKLTVTGSRFLEADDDVVLVDGAPRVTEFVNTTTLVATLLDDDVALPGTHTVTVTNRTGATSAPLTFSVSSQAGPVVTSIDPGTTAVGSAPFTATLTGTNFVDQSIVTIDTAPRATTFVSATQLRVSITASDLSSARTLSISVLNPDGLTSSPVDLPVLMVAPTIVSLSPASAIAGDTGFTLVISGSGFSNTSVVRLNSTTRPATFDAPTGRLLVSITASDIFAPASIAITVTGAGGTSTPVILAALAPQITSATPSSILAGSSDVVLTLTGTGFLPTSQIVYLGLPRPTTFNPITGRLLTTLSAADLAVTGAVAVLVQNNASAVSAPFIITVVALGAPRIDSIDPAVITAGAGATDLIVTGANFLTGAVIRLNGVAVPTDFISTSQVSTRLSAADLAVPRTIVVTVANADGTVSEGVNLTITPAPVAPGPRRRPVRH